MIKTRGSTKPDLSVTISDAAGTANFTALAAASIRVIGEQGDAIKFERQATSFTPAGDGKSGVVTLAWGSSDLDTVGHVWIRVKVTWAAGQIQYFPAAGPLRIDVVRASGDA